MLSNQIAEPHDRLHPGRSLHPEILDTSGRSLFPARKIRRAVSTQQTSVKVGLPNQIRPAASSDSKQSQPNTDISDEENTTGEHCHLTAANSSLMAMNEQLRPSLLVSDRNSRSAQ
jgi:hypothetical protein